VLDYSHRRNDGSVGMIPDSIKRSFKTTNGRTVYDGGGIDPDIKTVAVETHPVTLALYNKGFIFDYGTQYVYKHPQVQNAKSFSLSDEEYQQFVNWMKGKNYTYQSYLEYQFSEFENEAKKERYYQDLKNQLDQVRSKIQDSKKNELMLHKDQIKMLLEKDIVSRFQLEKGNVEAGFKYDTEIAKAIDVLHDQAEYKKILHLK
jgi:carboxyl-terminal processing protease